MHPMESSLYYSAALIPVFLGCHPIVAVACIMDLATGAWLGHDGFQVPTKERWRLVKLSPIESQ